VGKFTVYQFIASAAATIAQSLLSFDLLLSPHVQIVDAREASGAEAQDDQGDERRDELGAFWLYVEGAGQGPSRWSRLQQR
jgi:hypothetical protein